MTEATVMEPELQALRTEVLPSPIRIAATADTHGLAFPCPEADIFIHAGDMTAWGEWQETAAVGRMLGRQRYAAVILIPGNHDNALERSPRRDSYNFFPNTRLLIDQVWEYRGLLFYGSPWTQLIPGAFPLFAAFMRGEDELQRRFLNMPGTIDVLITHGPPKGVLDDDTGSVALREAVERRIIRRHIFGHWHAKGGRSVPSLQRDGSIRTSYNVAAITGGEKPQARPPLVFDL